MVEVEKRGTPKKTFMDAVKEDMLGKTVLMKKQKTKVGIQEHCSHTTTIFQGHTDD